MAKALGTDDSITTCDCCGRSNLKFTVTMELDDGQIVHYGQVCAGRNTGKSRPQITSEIKAARAAAVKAARAEYMDSPEYAAERARFAERSALPFNDPRRMGLNAADFVREASDAADAVCARIAARHGLSHWEVRA
ncbi:hypothetical protein [Pseudacidovorax sp. NFM-22]|uniref:hypothetical protein n=1 Tax=Pseudacidovorax sp. NFM-22 TaxID=2744469 RepID=UPI001F23448D|nr:hypothetical protein [Pseudacidovorax sp. NFM-22]